MKLPCIPEKTMKEKLIEFDTWITPSLGSIKDTERFEQEINDVVEIFEVIGGIVDGFNKYDEFDEQIISSHFIDTFSGNSLYEHLVKFSKVLFLVTGKSDNNIKCQFPVYLSTLKKFPGYPVEKNKSITYKKIPRTIKSNSLMSQIAKLSFAPKIQNDFLAIYVQFILSDTSSKAQFWALGNSYFNLKKYGKELDLLAPIIQFQVRGSVSASGGHIPERLLREQMSNWGLLKDTDFNSNDIVVDDLLNFLGKNRVKVEQQNKKTRAYDFVLPYKTKGWIPKIFIQCQFYAGDSGSVSHKNVDQARNSRNEVLKAIENPVFVEYVDGAGYFSSLNGDLKKLLSYSDTDSFIQLRTAPIKLRKTIQDIGFLTPLEIEHAILLKEGKKSEVLSLLKAEGYTKSEIQRCLQVCVSFGYIGFEDSYFTISKKRADIVRKYFILDCVAKNGKVLDINNLNGFITVPGYSQLFGLSLADLGNILNNQNPTIDLLWSQPKILLGDLSWLTENGFVIIH